MLSPDPLLRPDRETLLPLPPGEPLSLEHTFHCGQVFRWRRSGETWYGPYRSGSLAFRAVPEGVMARALGEEVTAGEAHRFLGLDQPLVETRAALRFDPGLVAAFEQLAGLRIVRQDPWECTATYLCSQWNNIGKIELSTGRIAGAWGMLHRWPEGVEVAAFPAPERLAALGTQELAGCALGYRCRYLLSAARLVASGTPDLAALREVPYEEALAQLLSLPGIGRKVADCILLFSLDKPAAVPVDVWVRRIVHELYPEELSRYLPDASERAGKSLGGREYDAIVRFARDRWGARAGLAQQYLFHARRMGLIGSPRRRGEGSA